MTVFNNCYKDANFCLSQDSFDFMAFLRALSFIKGGVDCDFTFFILNSV